MGLRIWSWLGRPGLLWSLFAQARLAVRLVREPRVPVLTKAVPLATLLYLIVPLDFVPDFIPLFGQIDDLALAVAAVQVFVRLAPQAVVAFHRGAIAQGRRYSAASGGGTVIDAEFKSS